MAISLDHTVVYAKNNRKSAKEFASVMNLSQGRIAGVGYDFTAVRVNNELAIYFMDRNEINLEQHLAFHVNGQEFDYIHKQLQKKKIAFGNSPFDRENKQINHNFAPRGLFWTNLDGCLFEIMTYES